jgi:hypothetical protein
MTAEPYAVDPKRGPKSGGFLELGCRRRETLVELIREQAPDIVLPTLDRALLGALFLHTFVTAK